jgi:hypothetical protein
MSKFVRTIITNEDGTITPARLNTLTGEIKPFTHWKKLELDEKRKRIEIKGSINTDHERVPLWELIPAPKYPTVDSIGRIPRKNKLNDNNVFLKEYMSLEQAKEDIPALDNLFEGVSKLDCGNSRPLHKGLLFSMLRDLDEINANTIQVYTGYSEKYCQRLAQYLRVLSTAFDKEIEK